VFAAAAKHVDSVLKHIANFSLVPAEMFFVCSHISIRRISVFTCRRPILHPLQSQQAAQHTRTGEGKLQVEAVKDEMVTRLSNRLVGHPSAKDWHDPVKHIQFRMGLAQLPDRFTGSGRILRIRTGSFALAMITQLATAGSPLPCAAQTAIREMGGTQILRILRRFADPLPSMRLRQIVAFTTHTAPRLCLRSCG
jgi:hypothetical protein